MGQTIGLVERTARTAKRCAWCKDGIQPGERYERWAYKDGGDFSSIQVHVICFAILELIRQDAGYWDDEFPCDRDDHDKGHGCHDCDPLNEAPQ